MRILVDADGCPVKPEIHKVAARYGLTMVLVANGGVDGPTDARVERILVPQGADAADDWIVDHAAADDVVVTADTPLAARCLPKVAAVVHPTGRRFTDDDIGSALAMRDLLAQLRESGTRTRGPAPFTDRDRSAFLQTLDAAIQKARRAR